MHKKGRIKTPFVNLIITLERPIENDFMTDECIKIKL